MSSPLGKPVRSQAQTDCTAALVVQPAHHRICHSTVNTEIIGADRNLLSFINMVRYVGRDSDIEEPSIRLYSDVRKTTNKLVEQAGLFEMDEL